MAELAPPPDAASVLAQQFTVQDTCRLEVNVPRVRTRLRPSSDDRRVSVDITVTGALDASPEAVMDRMEIGTRQVKNTIRIVTPPKRETPDWWRWLRTTDARVFLDIRVPSPVEAAMHVPGGTLVLSGLRGKFDVSVPGGAVQLQNLTGPITLHALRSRAELRDLDGPRLTLRASAAPVTLTDIGSEEVDVTTAAAPLTLQNAGGASTITAHAAPVTLSELSGPCQVTAHGGAVSFTGPVRANTELTTVGAPLTAHLSPDAGATLHATGTTVSLDESLPFAGEREADRLHGTLNGNGPSLSLRAVQAPVHCQAA